jgi:signal transduction histidine kinase
MHDNIPTFATAKVLLLDTSAVDEPRIAAALARDGWVGALTRVADRAAFESALRTGAFHIILAEHFPLDGEANAVHALQQGAADYVLKDQLDRLAPAVRRALEKAAERMRQREAEEALRATSRRKDAFLGMLGHELRNPLAALSNAVNLWRRKANDPAMQQWCQEVIERQAGNLTRLIDDMVDVSRVIRGLIRLNRQPLELSPLVRRVVDGQRALAETRRVVVDIIDEASAVLIDADAARLERALGNLLQNAIKFSPEGGRVHVTMRRGEEIEIVVRDEGLGLTAEDLRRLFDLFATLDQEAKRAQHGLGVGLTVARHLVVLHGGTLTAASPGLGLGSTFTVRLPCVAEVKEG